MHTPLTTPEKLLLAAIIIVISAICGSLYWGVQLLKSSTVPVVSEITQEDSADISEKPNPNVERTPEQKLELLQTLKTGSNHLTKQDRLDVIEKSQSDTEKSTLTVQQKMDILSGL